LRLGSFSRRKNGVKSGVPGGVPGVPGGVNHQILRLAIPNIVSNLSVPLLGLVDTALMGRLENVAYLGALAIGSMVFNFLYWGFGFLRMGTTGLTAQEFGAERREGMVMILVRVLFLAGLIGILMVLLKVPVVAVAFRFMDAGPEVTGFAQEYVDIRIFTAPAMMMLFGLQGWFLGMQNATFPMIITIVHNVLNIVLNLLFIQGFGMKVDGVAYGTLISTWLAFFLALGLFFWRYRGLMGDIRWDRFFLPEALLRYFSVNRDIFIRTLCLIFTFTFFTAMSARQGELVLAANTILLQLWLVASYGIDGFAYAAESLVGRYLGGRDDGRLQGVIRRVILWGVGLGAAISVVYGIFGRGILEIFTGNAEVIALAMSVIVWTVLAPAVSGLSYVLDGVFIGATRTGVMRNTMLIATLLVFLPVYWIGTKLVGVHGLWLAMLMFMLARGVSLAWFVKGIRVRGSG